MHIKYDRVADQAVADDVGEREILDSEKRKPTVLSVKLWKPVLEGIQSVFILRRFMSCANALAAMAPARV